MNPILPPLCALASLCIAAISVLGWALGIERLTSVLPGLPKLVPVTAVLTLLACISLWRAWRGVRAASVRPGGERGGRMAAATLLLAAVAICLCQLAGWFPRPFSAGSGAAVNARSLSSPVTAAMFGALGTSLLCLPHPRWRRCGQWLALGVLLLAMLTSAGYSFRDTVLYNLLPGKGTSILTALVLLLLAGGVLGLRPGEGIMVAVSGPEPGAWFARRLLASAMAMPVLLGVAAALALRFELADAATVVAFLVWGMIAMFTAVVWRLALQLYSIDLARRHAEQERQHALDGLREADARKDEFLAMLAHELRNPLAPIRAGAELLRRTRAADPQLRRTSEIISRQVDHMVHLVDDLLDVSRVTRGLITLDQAPVDAHRAVCDAVEQAKPLIAQRGHRLHTALGELHPTVLGDHQRLVQVVANLLGNAAKYTPEGGDIEVLLRADAREVEIEVRDNGIGIEATLLPQVFDIFTQATRTAGRAEGGLGLGLALVRRLTELHGGKVSASSAGLGQGSRFRVTLPRMQHPVGAPPLRPADDAADLPRPEAGPRPAVARQRSPEPPPFA